MREKENHYERWKVKMIREIMEVVSSFEIFGSFYSGDGGEEGDVK